MQDPDQRETNWEDIASSAYGDESARIIVPAAELSWILNNVYGYLEDAGDTELMERVDTFHQQAFSE